MRARYGFTLLLAALPAVVGPSPLSGQDWRNQRKEAPRLTPRHFTIPYGRLRAQAAAGRPAFVVVNEVEPNDIVAQATPAAVFDTVAGEVNPAGDVDYFSADLLTGQRLLLDIDASQVGSPLDPVMALIDRDSVTVLAFNDDFDGLDSRIEIDIPADGRYFIGVAGYAGQGGTGYWYQLRIDTVTPPPPGPGDPTQLFATGLGYPWGMTAGSTGDLFVVDAGGARLLRVDPAGIVTSVVGTDSVFYQDVVLDGFGDLLTAAFTPGGATIMRINPITGTRSVFTNRVIGPIALTVGPDGDVWVADVGVGALRRLDPLGEQRDSIPLPDFAFDIAFSPAGDLHFSNWWDGVYRLQGGAIQRVLTAPPYLEGLAFDRDGYLYVANGFLGEVHLYDPTYVEVGNIFARTNLGGPINLVFGRDGAGAMTSRLFADNAGFNLSPPYAGGIVEMNPSGMRAAGLRVGVDLLRIVTDALRQGVMGAPYADTLEVADPPAILTWALVEGTLPDGLELNAATGVISGFPAEKGTFELRCEVTGGGRFGLRDLTLRITEPTVSVTNAADALLGVEGAVTEDLARYLDLQGNRNGRYDVGDLRAYLRSAGQLNVRRAGAEERQP